MNARVGQAPNHYELLGLPPDATEAEIAQAFAREVRRARPFGEIARIGIAHEQLRDPAKRRAYDESIGLAAEPEPAPAVQPNATPGAFRQTVFETRPQPIQQRAPSRPAPPPSEPERSTGAFIAASLREPPPTLAEPPLEPHVRAPARAPEVRSASPPIPPRRFTEISLPVAEEAQIPWKRIGIAAGVVIAAGGLLGAWAGPRAEKTVVEAAPDPGVTVALPAAKPRAPSAIAAAPESAPGLAQAEPDVERRRAAAMARVATPLVPEAATADPLAAEPATDLAQAGQPGDAAAELASAAAAAAMPLSDRLVARTIHQIGYSCGNVTSTTAVDGGNGVFKVTCASGQSYRAAPVGGRYRFRKWGRQ